MIEVAQVLVDLRFSFFFTRKRSLVRSQYRPQDKSDIADSRSAARKRAGLLRVVFVAEQLRDTPRRDGSARTAGSPVETRRRSGHEASQVRHD